MKKINLIALFAFVVVSISIQASNPIRLGVTAGANFNKNKKHSNMKTGFHVGVTSDYHLVNNFYLNTSLLFIEKGTKSNPFYFSSEPSMEVVYTRESYYLELPIHLSYKINLSNSLALIPSAGPYLSVGLFGKAKNSIGESQSLYKKNSGDNRLDFGLGAKVAFQVRNKYQIGVGYDLGLVKTNKYHDNSKNRNLSVSLGYMF